ncbi:PAS domain S-box protein [Botrimarina mediterranea]|uniref:histidine kinase n=1 Tax=Botrimarina mediterranea TaxID=2528022 RepID=A0A518KD33_9BACT|nr:PAS domain S-box protein [Botrimarina mediterranea]QDV75710.1 Non-motile and phage-resistance protein [Botrimarina mediterranea]
MTSPHSDDLFQVTLASIGDAVIATDAMGRITFLNAVAETLTGWRNEDAKGRSLTEVFRIINEHTRAPVENPADKVLRHGRTVGLANHTILIAKDGREIPIDDSAAPIRGANGNLRGVVLVFRDIRERKEAEERLQESELRYRLIGQVANDAIWDWDLITNVVVWNEGVQASFGYRPDQIGATASWWLDNIHNDDRERISKSIHAVIDAGEFWNEEYRFRRADGDYATVFDRGRVVRDSGGAPVRMVGAMLDLSERLRTQRQLAEREERLRMAVESAAIGVWDFDPQSGSLEWSDRCKAMFGLPPDAHINYDVFLERLHPDDREQTHRVVMDALSPDGDGSYEIDYRTLWPDGTVRWLVARGQGYFEEEVGVRNAVRFAGTVLDVTARKRSEEAAVKRSAQLRRLADVASRIGVAHDVTSVLNIVTEEVRHVIEAHQSIASMTVDQEWAQAITSVSMSEKYAQWRNYDKPPDGSSIYTIVCKTNKPMRLTQAELEAHPAWREFSGDTMHPPMRGWLAAPMVGRDGRNLGLLQLSGKLEGEFTEDDEAVLVQLAQMAAVAVENARLLESLQQADRRKDEFLATLAHELRNPLAPIRMGLEVMKMGGLQASEIEDIREMMERQTKQLIALVDDLLDVSRITSGKFELRKCRVALADIVQSALEASTPFIDEAGHNLAVAVPDMPILLEADPHRLAQVISNLLNNAVNYTPEGGEIRLSASHQTDTVAIVVADNGIGIPLEMQQHVFEIFAQLDRPLEKGYVGLGIGLTLVKRLVEMHDGTVEVHSDGAGKGSTFTVRLPIVNADELQRRPIEFSSDQASTKKRRVLIVDDNKAAADMLGLVVKMLGCDIRTAYDGQEAVEVAAEYLPEVIVMDIGMPKMNGYEAASHIRRTPWGKDILLVALTGWGQEEDRLRTREAGFDHHLVKPADPDALQQVLFESRD